VTRAPRTPELERPEVARDLEACAALARAHYENFAIGSRLLPRRLRLPLAAIYATVRIADDLADERTAGSAAVGDSTAEARDADANGARTAAMEIDAWQSDLDRAAAGEAVEHFALRACGAVIRAFDLPLEAFHALFRAFRRDTAQTRYASFDELLGYCRDSANPVGRLVLGLFGARDPALHPASDAICTGLQLVNHWQDVAADARRGRIYLPQEDLSRFGVAEAALLRGEDSPALRALLAAETARARAFLERGTVLVAATRGRLRLEVALFRRGGLAACDALARAGFAVMQGPPRLRASDRARVLALGLADTLRAGRARTVEASRLGEVAS